MAVALGSIMSKFTLDISDLSTKLKLAEEAIQNTERKFDGWEDIGNRISGLGTKLTFGLTMPILGAGAASFKLASDMSESINKVDVAFKGNAQEVKTWADTTLEKFGLAESTALDMASTFGDMGTAMGFNTDQAAKMSMSLVGLGADMASFKNVSIERANSALTGIYTGETESLKAMGIVMTQVNLQEFAASQGIKKKIEDMTQAELVQLRYNYVMSVTKNAQGDFARTSDGAANQMRIFSESLKELGATFGENLLPVITPMINKVNEIVKAFGAMDKEQQQMIIKTLGVVAVVGPAILIFGKLVTAIGAISTFFGMFSAAAVPAAAAVSGVGAVAGTSAVAVGGFGGAIGLATAGIAPFLLAAAGIAGAGYLIYKAFATEAVPAVNLFADSVDATKDKTDKSYKEMLTGVEGATTKISKATQEAVGAYIKLDDDASAELYSLYATSTVMTDQTTNSLITKYNNMGKAIKTGLDKNYNAQYQTMQDFFNKSGTLTDEEEAEVIKKMTASNEDKKLLVDQGLKRIQEITQTASNEKRALYDWERRDILNIQNQMKTDAVGALSASEQEQAVIMGRIKDYGVRITAEQASSVIQKAEEQRMKTVDQANIQYEQTVAAIKYQRDVTGTLSVEQAQKLIDEAERQRSDTIAKADDQKKQVVEKITSMNADIGNSVDLTTGRMKTAWDSFGTAVANAISKAMSWIDRWNEKNMYNKTGTMTITQYTNALEGPKQTSGPNAGRPVTNWTGTRSFQGGFTTLHEKGYELYDLPQGTRIFNHEASAELVRQTATEVAKTVLSRTNGKEKEKSNQTSIGTLLHADKIEVRNDSDIEKLAIQLALYMKKVGLATGVK